MEEQDRSGRLFVPVSQEAGASPRSGPKILVFLSFSNLALESTAPEVAYWGALREADVTNGIGEFAWINAHLSTPLLTSQVLDEDIQRQMMNCFLEPELHIRVTRNVFPGAAPVVFNRIGSLLAIRHLILCGTMEPRNWNPYKVGRLALLANDFVPQPTQPKSNPPSSLELSLLTLPTWDVNNVRNLGHAMSRIFTILTEILTGSDPIVRDLVSQLAISPDGIEIDGLPLRLFSSIVFALYAYARPQSSPPRVWLNIDEVFAQTGLSKEFLPKFLAARARTIDDFRAIFAKGQSLSQVALLDELKRKQFLINSLNVFRRYPFLKLDSERFLMLDVQFVSELLTSGVYWSIHDSLPDNKHEAFKQLWGRMFELYVVSLLSEFYPETSRMLSADLQYRGGQIDALLDFGDFVLLFEIKSSFLTEPAKRRFDEEAFLLDFRRKFVENERGKPKAIKQLAGACAAIVTEEIGTARFD